MNDSSPMKKALLARGDGLKLTPDFMGATMLKVAQAERRHKRNILIWSIVGYAVAVAIVVATIIFVCGEPLMRALSSIVAETEGAGAYLPTILSFIPVGVILFLTDSYLHRKMVKETFSEHQTS